MDKFDQQILQLLSENARRSVAAIGEQIGLSRTAVNERIKKLEQSGVIQGYTLRQRAVDNGSLICAYFELTFRPFDVDAVRAAICSISAVKQAHALSGETDLMVYVEADSMAKLNQVRQQLAELDHLDKLQTSMGFEQLI